MMNDMIADGLTRIRNAYMRKLEYTTLLHSKTVEAVVANLAKKGYVDNFKVITKGVKKTINVTLKYDENEQPVINELKRVSKPGRRVYKPVTEIKKFKNGYGSLIISTSQGVMVGEEAYRNGIGGEILCSVW